MIREANSLAHDIAYWASVSLYRRRIPISLLSCKVVIFFLLVFYLGILNLVFGFWCGWFGFWYGFDVFMFSHIKNRFNFVWGIWCFSVVVFPDSKKTNLSNIWLNIFWLNKKYFKIFFFKEKKKIIFLFLFLKSRRNQNDLVFWHLLAHCGWN